jgi:CCR4-NOT transcription complex subunit 1
LDQTKLFSFACNVLASPSLLPPTGNLYDRCNNIIKEHFDHVLNALRNPGVPTFGQSGGQGEDLAVHEARQFILAIYPRVPEEGGANFIDPTPAQLNAVRELALDTNRREAFLRALVDKFGSPFIVLQALASVSPGAPPSSPKAIPLAEFLFELGDSLTSDEGIVQGVVAKWWAGIINNREEGSRELEMNLGVLIRGLIKGIEAGRLVDVQGVVRGLASIVSRAESWGLVGDELIGCFLLLFRPGGTTA